jgi:pimeloyl-ACP methyl ester carboxylesterase
MATIVFLPGLPVSSAMFDAQAEALNGVHDVHQLDYPGFNGRPLPDGLQFDDYVDSVRRDIEAIGNGPAVLVGLSFGAQVALKVAQQYPDAVSALVLSNTQGTASTEQERQMFLQVAEAAEAHGSGALVENLSRMLLSAQTQAGRPEVVARVGELIAEAPGEAVASAFRALADRPDPASVVGDVKAPVLLVFGTGDQAVPTSNADALQASLGDARSHHIDGAGHFPPLETPGEYTEALKNFVDSRAM